MKRSPGDGDHLAVWLNHHSRLMVRDLNPNPNIAMLNEPDLRSVWWAGAFEQSPEEYKLLDSAAIAIAHRQPLPELTPAQTARLALRLRLCACILSAQSNRYSTPLKGWFPNKLARMSEPELLTWLLINTWRIWREIFSEAQLWSLDLPHNLELRPLSPS